MNVRRARLRTLAFAGGHTLSLLVAFLPDLTYIFGSVGTVVISGASIVAMVPFVVSESLDGFSDSGVWGLLGELGSAVMALTAFGLTLFLVRPDRDATGGIEALAYALPVLVFYVAFISDRPRVTRAV